MLREIFINLVAEIASVFILVAAAVLFYKITRRSSLRDFFGLNHSKKVIIFLSNLNHCHMPRTAAPESLRFYPGPSIPYFEILMVAPLIRLFNVIVPGFGDLPHIFKTVTLSDIDVKYKASPGDNEQAHIPSQVTVFSFGGPRYNEISRYIQEKLPTRMVLDEDNKLVSDKKTGELISNGKSVALVQKVFDRNRNQWFFYIAGIDAHGMKGALYFLVKNWNKLYSRYGQRDFSICLEFPWSGSDRDSYKLPKVVKRMVKHQNSHRYIHDKNH